MANNGTDSAKRLGQGGALQAAFSGIDQGATSPNGPAATSAWHRTRAQSTHKPYTSGRGNEFGLPKT